MQLVSPFSLFKFGDKGLNITKKKLQKKDVIIFNVYSTF